MRLVETSDLEHNYEIVPIVPANENKEVKADILYRKIKATFSDDIFVHEEGFTYTYMEPIADTWMGVLYATIPYWMNPMQAETALKKIWHDTTTQP